MKITIADSELPIMKVLWGTSPLTSPEIFAQMEGNASTQKTLLKRLVEKGAVEATAITSRSYSYAPAITQAEYTAQSSRRFLDKVFDGSSQAMLLNFVQEEQVTVAELQSLLELLKEES